MAVRRYIPPTQKCLGPRIFCRKPEGPFYIHKSKKDFAVESKRLTAVQRHNLVSMPVNDAVNEFRKCPPRTASHPILRIEYADFNTKPKKGKSAPKSIPLRSKPRSIRLPRRVSSKSTSGVDLSHRQTRGGGLDDVSLEIQRAIFVAIMDQSGSGKSTLSDIGRLSAGGVGVQGLDRDELAEIRNRKIGDHGNSSTLNRDKGITTLIVTHERDTAADASV
jgi:hypothetical protein